MQPPEHTYATLKSPTQIGFLWTDSPTSSVTAYRISRSTGSGAWTQIAEVLRSDTYQCGSQYPHCLIDQPPAGTSCYRVVSVDAEGHTSDPSPTSCATRP